MASIRIQTIEEISSLNNKSKTINLKQIKTLKVNFIKCTLVVSK